MFATSIYRVMYFGGSIVCFHSVCCLLIIKALLYVHVVGSSVFDAVLSSSLPLSLICWFPLTDNPLQVELTFSTLECETNQVYIKVKKVSAFSASSESYQILDGDTLLAQSPPFSDNEVNESEYCVDTTVDSIYTLRLMDSLSDSWSRGSYIEVKGVSDNVVFKGFMVNHNQESHRISLAQPINQGAVWKFRSGTTTSSTWYLPSFDDATWSSYIDGTSSRSTQGTQFFRKEFTGRTEPVVYEVRFFYRYGIVAYLNGIEIFRDHLPEETLSASTFSNGDYVTPDYYGVILPNTLIQGRNVIAVAIHVPSSILAYPIQFDAWMALYLPDNDEEVCYTVPFDASAIDTNGNDVSRIMNWGTDERWIVSPITSNVNLTLSYPNAKVRSKINSVRFYASNDVSYLPNVFVLYGVERGDYSRILRTIDPAYTTNSIHYSYGLFDTKPFPSYQLAIDPPWSGSLVITDLQLAVCRVHLPETMELTSSTIITHRNVETVYLYPKLGIFSNCSVSPLLPNGLSLDVENCIVAGIPTTVQAATTYTLHSTSGNGYSALFSITVTECSGSVVRIRYRKARSSIADFGFTIATPETTLFTLSPLVVRSQTDVHRQALCVTSNTLVVSLYSARGYWAEDAFLELSRALDDEVSDLLLYTVYDAVYLYSSSVITISLDYVINTGASWYYQFDSLSDDWFSDSMSGWKLAASGRYPSSDVSFQLFKQTFLLTSSQLESAGVVLHVKYLAGVVVYLNSVEVFRNHVDGELSRTTRASASYPSLRYRAVTLPMRRIAEGGRGAALFKEGSNTIAIALIAGTAIIPTVSFDASLRLLSGTASMRSFDMDVSGSGIENPELLFNPWHSNSVSSTSCGNNYIQIVFREDRFEWISSLTFFMSRNSPLNGPASFTVRGCRDTLGANCDTLQTVSGLQWWRNENKKRIFLSNSKPYNVYRIEDFHSASTSQCFWQLHYIELFSDQVRSKASTLTYPSSVTSYAQVDMPEVYPNSDLFHTFVVSPSLPAGLTLDSTSGIIRGIPQEPQERKVYTITAVELNGASVSAQLTIEILTCANKKHIITAAFFLTSELSTLRAVLKTSDGTIESSLSQFEYGYQMLYHDFCLSEAVYTLVVTAQGGLTFPAGVMLYTGTNFGVFEYGTIPQGTGDELQLHFSSYLPFTAGVESWEVSTLPVSDDQWTRVTSAVSGFSTRKPDDLGVMESPTVYLRRIISIPSLQTYHTLNVEVVYRGGIVAFFNGHRIARFNLRDGFSSSTYATEVAESTLSRFHVLLSTYGAVNGNNVIAFELHRDGQQTKDSSIVFSATSVFGIAECSIVPDTITPKSDDYSAVHDQNLSTFASYPTSTTNVEFSLLNMEGGRWNSLSFLVGESTVLSLSIDGRVHEDDKWTRLYQGTDVALTSQIRNRIPLPLGMAGFLLYRITLDTPLERPIVVQEVAMEYCVLSDVSCPALDGYDMTPEGGISISGCGDGYGGYSFRTCTNGVLGPVNRTHCLLRAPSDLVYPSNPFVFVKDTFVSTGVPTVSNMVNLFQLRNTDVLPAGLTFDNRTGVISGVPTTVFPSTVYEITAWNDIGSTRCSINIQVREATCVATELFKEADLDVTQVGQCRNKGNYFGTVVATCVLGDHDGVWKKTRGFCISVPLAIILLVVVCLLVIAGVCICLVRKCSASHRNRQVLRKQIEEASGKPSGSILVNNGYLSVDNPAYGSRPPTASSMSTAMTSHMEKGLGIVPGLRKTRQLNALRNSMNPGIEMTPSYSVSNTGTMISSDIPTEVDPVRTETSASVPIGAMSPRYSVPGSVSFLRPVTPRGMSGSSTPRLAVAMSPRPYSARSTFAGSMMNGGAGNGMNSTGNVNGLPDERASAMHLNGDGSRPSSSMNPVGASHLQQNPGDLQGPDHTVNQQVYIPNQCESSVAGLAGNIQYVTMSVPDGHQIDYGNSVPDQRISTPRSTTSGISETRSLVRQLSLNTMLDPHGAAQRPVTVGETRVSTPRALTPRNLSLTPTEGRIAATRSVSTNSLQEMNLSGRVATPGGHFDQRANIRPVTADARSGSQRNLLVASAPHTPMANAQDGYSGVTADARVSTPRAMTPPAQDFSSRPVYPADPNVPMVRQSSASLNSQRNIMTRRYSQGVSTPRSLSASRIGRRLNAASDSEGETTPTIATPRTVSVGHLGGQGQRPGN